VSIPGTWIARAAAEAPQARPIAGREPRCRPRERSELAVAAQVCFMAMIVRGQLGTTTGDAVCEALASRAAHLMSTGNRVDKDRSVRASSAELGGAPWIDGHS
jgi:hypothetical protein